jgi:hypothetical protein
LHHRSEVHRRRKIPSNSRLHEPQGAILRLCQLPTVQLAVVSKQGCNNASPSSLTVCSSGTSQRTKCTSSSAQRYVHNSLCVIETFRNQASPYPIRGSKLYQNFRTFFWYQRKDGNFRNVDCVLALQLSELYTDDYIFDRFSCCASKDGAYFATGSYSFLLLKRIDTSLWW